MIIYIYYIYYIYNILYIYMIIYIYYIYIYDYIYIIYIYYIYDYIYIYMIIWLYMYNFIYKLTLHKYCYASSHYPIFMAKWSKWHCSGRHVLTTATRSCPYEGWMCACDNVDIREYVAKLVTVETGSRNWDRISLPLFPVSLSIYIQSDHCVLYTQCNVLIWLDPSRNAWETRYHMKVKSRIVTFTMEQFAMKLAWDLTKMNANLLVERSWRCCMEFES